MTNKFKELIVGVAFILFTGLQILLWIVGIALSIYRIVGGSGIKHHLEFELLLLISLIGVVVCINSPYLKSKS